MKLDELFLIRKVLKELIYKQNENKCDQTEDQIKALIILEGAIHETTPEEE